MNTVQRIEQLVEPALRDLGYSLVRVMLMGTKRLKLEFLIERLDDKPVSIDDCVRASREISTLLDVEDPIDSSYTLEVSSPGLERPLVKKQDYQRFVGNKIKLETHDLIEGQRRFKGNLESADEEEIILIEEENDRHIKLRYEQILKAKLQPDFK